MRSVLRFWKRRYGDTPVHLVLHLITFAIALFALHRIVVAGHAINFIAWFLLAAVLHDMVLVPLYSLLDIVSGSVFGVSYMTPRGVPVINHVRAPALISAILLLVYLPEITGKSEHTYFNVSGHPLRPYLLYWIVVSAALFLGSAVVYAIRVHRVAGTPAAAAVHPGLRRAPTE